jgi:hypothetical protein
MLNDIKAGNIKPIYFFNGRLLQRSEEKRLIKPFYMVGMLLLKILSLQPNAIQ